MNNYWKIILLVLLLTVSCIFIGCAQKLTEEQAVAEEQALVDMIQSYMVNVPIERKTKSNVLAYLKSKKPNQRLVLLSPNASLRFLRERGYKISRSNSTEYMTYKGPNYTSKGRRTIRKHIKTDDPQYWQIGKSRIMITGMSVKTNTVRPEENLLIIYDQYDNLRVVTYE